MRYISVLTEIPIICIQFFGNKSSVRSYRLGIPNYPILALTMAIILFLNFLSDLTIKHIQFFCRELAVIVLFRLELILFLCIRIKEKGFGSGCRSDSISVFLCEEVFFDNFFSLLSRKRHRIAWLSGWQTTFLVFHCPRNINFDDPSRFCSIWNKQLGRRCDGEFIHSICIFSSNIYYSIFRTFEKMLQRALFYVKISSKDHIII